MKGFSTELKIGLAILVAILVGVTWMAGGRHEQTRAPDPGGPEVVPPFARGPKGERQRVQERLSRLREERDIAGRQGLIARKLRERPSPVPRADQDAGAPTDETGAAETEEIADLDFDSLEWMALHDEDPDNRVAGVWLIASLDDEPVVPVLAQALSDQDPEVRLAAIQALSEFSDEAPIESIAQALEDSDPEIRFEAVSLAAEISDPRIQPLIAKAMEDPDEDVSALAAGVADMEETYHEAQPEERP